MKKWLISLFVVIPLFIVGCSSNSNDEKIDTNKEPLDPSTLEVVVDILTAEKLPVNETVELRAKVSQNNEAVNDASVEFEVWESGFRDKGQMIEGTFDKNGEYKAQITFDHDGVYYMFAHTNARGMHVMPKKQLIVGNPDMSKIVEDHSSDTMEPHDISTEHNSDSHTSDENSKDSNESLNHNNSSSNNHSDSHNESSHNH